MLFVHCKDTNLKAIHNVWTKNVNTYVLFVHCKDTNLKAIHNTPEFNHIGMQVVRALQRY